MLEPGLWRDLEDSCPNHVAGPPPGATCKDCGTQGPPLPDQPTPADPQPTYAERMIALLRDGCRHTDRMCLCELGVSLLTRQPLRPADDGPDPSAIVEASRDSTRHPRDTDGKYTPRDPMDESAIEAAAEAIGNAIPPFWLTVTESTFADAARAAYAAMEPIIRRQVAEQIAAEIKTRRAALVQTDDWDWDDGTDSLLAAAAIAREIGEGHA